MANPKNNSVDISKIIGNLFQFLVENQAAELEKVRGELPNLPSFKKLYTSSAGRLSTVFPCLMLVKKEKATDFSQDILSVALRLTFEVSIQGGKTDAIVIQADKYSAALESMLINIPPGVLTDGEFSIVDSIETEIETEFDLMRGNSKTKPTAFLQQFQTQITYILKGESY